MKTLSILTLTASAAILASCNEDQGPAEAEPKGSSPTPAAEVKGSGTTEMKGSGTKPAPAEAAPEAPAETPTAPESTAAPTFDREAAIAKLTPIQKRVALEDGTEPAFSNAYWDSKKDGIYVDILSGKPLFSSTHKFKSGTGWPSFYQPIDPAEIVENTDYKIGYPRTEVRGKTGDTHLGHVFPDGPKPTGLRYCINSAAMKFVPKEEMEAAGYGELLSLFSE